MAAESMQRYNIYKLLLRIQNFNRNFDLIHRKGVSYKGNSGYEYDVSLVLEDYLYFHMVGIRKYYRGSLQGPGNCDCYGEDAFGIPNKAH